MYGKKLLILLSISLIIFSNFSYSTPKSIEDLKPTVILISLDGYRYDYIDIYKSENLYRLAQKGVRAKWMIPVFPTKTFPNHYSIATGLYVENHGIIGNKMYDPEFKATFSLSKREEVQNPRWWQGEPIWVTAEKQGVQTAAYFFPGTETKIQGIQPTFWKLYDGSIPNTDRVDQILAWLELPVEERPQFYTLYFSDLDDAGHDYSPDSSTIALAITHVDSCIGRLIVGLEAREIAYEVNLIVVSDHGMATVQPNNIIILDDYFNVDDAKEIIWAYQLVHIFPKEDKEETIYKSLTTNNLGHLQCYRKEDIPDRFHFKNNRRIAPILCVAEEGWELMKRSRYEEKQNYNKLTAHPTGAHGYDNRLQSMQAIFMAHGPAFKKGKVVKPFENIHVYNIVARILDIIPVKNDGGMEVAQEVLR